MLNIIIPAVRKYRSSQQALAVHLLFICLFYNYSRVLRGGTRSLKPPACLPACLAACLLGSLPGCLLEDGELQRHEFVDLPHQVHLRAQQCVQCHLRAALVVICTHRHAFQVPAQRGAGGGGAGVLSGGGGRGTGVLVSGA